MRNEDYFSRFNSQIDEAFNKEVAEAEKLNADLKFDKVPDGTYRVEVIDMLLKKSKKGNWMVQTTYKILEGQYEKNAVYQYSVLRANNMFIINNYLKSLGTDFEIKYETELQYAKLIDDILTTIKNDKEYDLEITTSDSGFTNYKILNVYDKEPEEIPFS